MKKAKQASSIKAHTRVRQQRRQSWLPVALISVGGVILVSVVILFLLQPGPQTVQPVRIGARLGNFTLTDVSGNKVQLSDYKGKVVLVNAWATWCPPCRAEMPALNAYYQEHAADGFVILAVNAGDQPDDAASFATAYGLAFPVLLDPGTRLLSGLNIRSFPTSVMIGRDGMVKDIHIGMLTPEQIEAKVGPLLQQ